MAYKVGIGFDVAPEDMTTLDPQPFTPGLIATRRQNGISGRVIDEALYIPFTYTAIDGPEEYQSILAQWGLSSSTTAEVSISAQDENYADDYIRNGIAIKPQLGTDGQRSDMLLRNFVINVTRLRAQS